MVNVGFSWGSLIGIVLAVAGAALYFLRSVRPGLARDYDIFFAAVGLLCGGILFFNSWRLDPILQFSQFLLAGSTIFFAYESVRLRGVTTEQAKRSAPPVSYDDDRPVSRVYRAELDELEPEPEPQPFLRRIRGTDDTRNTGSDGYGAYDDGPPKRRRPPTGRPGRPPSSGPGQGGRPPTRRPPGRPGRSAVEDGWDDDRTAPPRRAPSGGPDRRPPTGGAPGDGGPPRRRRRPPSGPPVADRPQSMNRTSRPQPPSIEDIGTPYLDEDEPPTRPSRQPEPPVDETYVDYQPLDADASSPVVLDDRDPQVDDRDREDAYGDAPAAGSRPLDLGPPDRSRRDDRGGRPPVRPVADTIAPPPSSSQGAMDDYDRSGRSDDDDDYDDYDDYDDDDLLDDEFGPPRGRGRRDR